MRVLVLDGHENQAVASVRSLARAGYWVEVGSPYSWSKAGLARGCRRSFTYPAPQKDLEAFVACVAEEVKKSPGALVLPMTERTTLPLSAHREMIFAAQGRLVMPPHETVLRAFDKYQTTELACSLGITTPRTLLLKDATQAAEVVHNFPLPAVLKPRSSEEVSGEGQVRATGAPLYARNPSEFLRAYSELRQRCTVVLAQEFIEGFGAGYFALMRDGELRAEFAHRRVRDVRPTGSGSAVRLSIKPDPQVREASLALLQALRWHGPAMVEFRIRPDGVPVFMEVNGRFWNSLALAIYAGVDFPSLTCMLAEHGDVKPVCSYRVGVRCRWMLGDFRHLLEVWKGKPEGFPGSFPGRLRTLWDFLKPVPGTFHDNFNLRDPLPEIADWVEFAVRRLPEALRKNSSRQHEMHAQRGYSRS